MPDAGYKRTKAYGVIHPDSLYTRDGVMEAIGLGNDSINKAKQSGIVKPIQVGPRVFFIGSEIIEWVKSHAKGA